MPSKVSKSKFPKAKKASSSPTRRQTVKSERLRIAVTFDFESIRGYFLKPDVVRSLTQHQVEVVPLLYDTLSLDSVLDTCDGLMIPGGVGDVDPALYGQKKKYDRVIVNRERSEFESHLLDRFLTEEKPFLGICWGLQMLNVFLGGTLHQDIPQDIPTKILHEQKEAPHIPTHSVSLISQGWADEEFESVGALVNSTHHQAIDDLGRGLVIEATSPEDKIVEAVRLRNHPYAWAVQWHPERLKDDPIIPHFVKACRKTKT